MLKTRIILILLLQFSFLKAQNVQWASHVIAYSSQYAEKQYSAIQALGKPNVLPTGKDSPCAWSPKHKQSRTDEYIHVAFAKAISISQLAVAESQNPGAISKIIAYDTEGKVHEIYSNPAPQPVHQSARMFRIAIKKTPYQVKSVKVILNTLGFPGWVHIDAIGISSEENPIRAIIDLAEAKFEGKRENLGSAVNSSYDEIMPIISPDGKTLYFDRKDHPQNTGKVNNDDIWFSRLSPKGNWSKAVNIGYPLNNSGHNFLAAITPDGNQALLGNVYEANGIMSPGVSISQRTNKGWSKPGKLRIRNFYNVGKYSEFHLAADGKTLVMAIERDDSYGGKDLYVSFLEEDGIWSVPVNLGPTINTAATELSPFLAADGKTLYFSSGGFSGYGSKDLYLSRRLDNSWTRWSSPKNLGAQINSAQWDAYYSVPASGEYAYFCSEKNAIGKTDIFRIKIPQNMQPEPVVLVRGKVLDAETNLPVQAKIIYETLSDGKEAGVAISSPNTGEYTIALPAGEQYGFLAQSSKYVSVHQNLDLTRVSQYKELRQNLSLAPIRKGETIVLNNIFFPPAKAELAAKSEPELNRVVRLMQEHKSLKIEIAGHTDDGCKEDFCLKLSTLRAKAVYDYLSKKGINSKRMQYKGYGSSKPRKSNATAEGKRANRRVEFTILEI